MKKQIFISKPLTYVIGFYITSNLLEVLYRALRFISESLFFTVYSAILCLYSWRRLKSVIRLHICGMIFFKFTRSL